MSIFYICIVPDEMLKKMKLYELSSSEDNISLSNNSSNTEGKDNYLSKEWEIINIWDSEEDISEDETENNKILLSIFNKELK